MKQVIKVRWRELYPTRTEMRRSWPSILRGTAVGFLVGLIPGPAAVVAPFASYAIEKRVSKYREEFGTGAIEGVAGPESANNAAGAGAMIPLLALGIPFAPATAVLLGGFMIHGIAPGPLFMERSADIFWGIVASMYIGNLLLLILNLPLVGVFASLVRVPQKILVPLIIAICVTGVYAVNNSIFDIVVMVVAGICGYALQQLGFEVAPLILGIVLGPFTERMLRESLIMYNGKFLLILDRPLFASLVLLSICVIVTPWLKKASSTVSNRVFKRAPN